MNCACRLRTTGVRRRHLWRWCVRHCMGRSGDRHRRGNAPATCAAQQALHGDV